MNTMACGKVNIKPQPITMFTSGSDHLLSISLLKERTNIEHVVNKVICKDERALMVYMEIDIWFGSIVASFSKYEA